MSGPIVWFDMPVLDVDRACKFYSAVLAQDVSKHEMGGWTMGVFPHEGEGKVGGCLVVAQQVKPSDQGTLLYFNCEGRLDAAIAAAEANGGKVVSPKESIGEYGQRAIVLDSEGNRIALHSH